MPISPRIRLSAVLAAGLLAAISAPADQAQAGVSTPPRKVASGAGAGPYHPLTNPVRILDTRNGTGAQAGQLGPGQTLDIQVAGVGGVPAGGAASVTINVTAVGGTSGSYLSVYPTGSDAQMAVSTVNFARYQTVANLASVELGAGGKVSVYNSVGSVDVLFDEEGWSAAAGESGTAGLFAALPSPVRILDTRLSGGPLGQGARRSVNVASFLGSASAAAVLNVTAVNGTHASYLQVWPTGAAQPVTSNVNFTAHSNLANRVVTRIGAGGKVEIYNAVGAVDVVVDLTGSFGDGSNPGFAGGMYHPVDPVRIYDTRLAGNQLYPGETRQLTVVGDWGVPSDAGALAVNVTVTNATSGSLLELFPGGQAAPLASDINFGPSQVVANLAVIAIGMGGTVSIFNDSGYVDAIFDVAGWFDGPQIQPPPPPDWPGPSNTGVPAGTQLTPSGSITVTTPGTTIDARDVAGTIEVTAGASNVTIRRTRVRSGDRWPLRIDDGAANVLIEDVEVDGLNSDQQQAAIGWGNFTARRVNLHNTPEGVRLSSNGTVQDSWIHDLCGACAGYHSQDIGNFGGSHNRILHNNLSHPHEATAVVFIKSDLGAVSDVVVDGNLLDGGGYTVYSRDGGHGNPSGIMFSNNHFGRTYVYGIRSLDGSVGWSGNVWDDNGAPAP